MTVLPQDSVPADSVDATAGAEHFFAAARDSGLAHVVISPGSRSSALAVAVSRTPDLPYSIELDERVASFVALGIAKRTGRPVGLVCTSGTAAANYLPAIAEASMSNVPLVAVTADRPPEHQRWGVGQSFDQRGLYRQQVRDEITMPVGGSGGANFCIRAGSRSVATAIERRGPVHVNWAFRLPVEPTARPIDAPKTLTVHARSPYVSAAEIAYLADRVREADAPVVIAGPDAITSSEQARSALGAFAELGIPVFADVLSGLRAEASAVLIDAQADVVKAAQAPTPDLVIRLGHTPTAKATRLWWETLDVEHILIDPYDLWHDPSHLATGRCTSDPVLLFQGLIDSGVPAADPAWLESWRKLGAQVAAAIDEELLAWPTVTEAHIARTLIEATRPGDQIVASSSMPIRDLDSFAPTVVNSDMFANRGINGIDGVISTAMGIRTASPGGRTYVLIGDVAAFHDIGGLLSAARNGVTLTVVVPNNDGGGIFSFLPIRDALDDAEFDQLFHTSHGATLEFLSAHDGVTYQQVSDLRNALIDTATTPGVVILEVAVDTPERLALARALSAAVQSPPA